MVGGSGEGAARPQKAALLSVWFAESDSPTSGQLSQRRRFFDRLGRHNAARAWGKVVQPYMAGMMVLQRVGHGLVALGVTALIASAGVRAENLDQGKSGPKLFADTCATCHRSARGLAKGRFSVTLYLYLQEHYASNGTSAWALTSYLESLDDAPRSRPHAAATKRTSSTAAASTAAAKPEPSTWTPQSSLRPPAPVPQR